MTSQQERAPCYQWLLYNWVDAVLAKGTERILSNEPLSVNDLLDLPEFEMPDCNAARLREAWNEELKLSPTAPQLMRAIRTAYFPRAMLGGVLRLVSDGCAFGGPFILKGYINWLNDASRPAWEGYVWALGLAGANLCMSFSLNASTHHTLTCFNQIRVGLAVLVFDAAMNLKSNHGMSGKVISAHASDSAKFAELGMFIHGLWVSPILVLAALVALYFFVGWAGLLVVVIMIIATPLQGLLMSKVFGLRAALMKIVDRRVQSIDEALQGIRICKFMGWEVPFAERIASIRGSEVEVLGSMYAIRLVATTIFTAMPTILTIALFGIAYAFDPKNISAANVFPALAMMNVIRIPMMFIPMSFAKLVETRISSQRITDVLTNVERQEYVVTEPPSSSEPAIEVRGVTVVGDKEVVITDKLHVCVPAGKLTMIIGSTGSGKSAMISAMVGEAAVLAEGKAVSSADAAASPELLAPTRKAYGDVVIRGSLAYVPQEAWIMNSTVKGNILMNSAFDAEKYIDALIACQLMYDLEQLPA